MDRYSIIYGTNQAGAFGYLANSTELNAFLRRIGSTNNIVTVDHVFQFMAGFTKQSQYAKEGKGNAPLSVRYAPLYLHKLSTMPPNIEPFNVITINGLEHRDSKDGKDTRETIYSHAVILSRELLLQRDEGGLCYLDQIFGTHLTNWTELRDFRNGRFEIPLDEAPSPVVPLQLPRDEKIVLQVAEALYSGKCVVLRLDGDTNFNDRSMSLLTQIYSLIQPRLAAEVGFATYVDVPEIKKLQEQTSIRLFLVPAECQLDGLPSNYVVIDSANPAEKSPENQNLTQALQKWYNLSWDRRSEAMAYLFLQPEIENKYLKAEIFVETTEKFFRNPFFSWLKSSENNGTISTLRELRLLREKFDVCDIPWCSKLFDKKIQKLLKPDVKLSSMVAQALASARRLEAQKEEIAPEIVADFKFARQLSSTVDYSKDYYQIVFDSSTRDMQEAMRIEKNRFEKEIASKSAEVEKLNYTTRQKLEAADQEKKREIQDARNKCADEIARANREKETAIHNLKTEYETVQRQQQDRIYQSLIRIADNDSMNRRLPPQTSEQFDIERIIQTIKDKQDRQNQKIKQKEQDYQRLLDEYNELKSRRPSGSRSGFFGRIMELPLLFKIILGVTLAAVCALLVLLLVLPKKADGETPTTEPSLPTPAQTTVVTGIADTETVPVVTEESSTEVDFCRLQELMQAAENADTSGRTWAAEAALRKAIKEAERVRENVPPIQSDIDEACQQLQAALNMTDQMDWEAIARSVPEIQFVKGNDLAEINPPVELGEKNAVVAVVSITPEFDLAALSAGPDDVEEGRTSESSTANGKNYAVIVEGPMKLDDAKKATGVKLILRAGRWTSFCYGDDDMALAAIRLMDQAVPKMEVESVPGYGAEYPDSEYMQLRFEENESPSKMIEFNLKKFPEWWRGITEFRYDNDALKQMGKELRVSEGRNLVFGIAADEVNAIVIDYGENSDLIQKSLNAFNDETKVAWQVDNYVVILYPPQKTPSNPVNHGGDPTNR